MKKLNEIVITNIADSLDLEDKEVEITENGTQTIRPSQGYDALRSVEVTTNVSGGSGYTGHADAAGLRAIGWTDDDIAYYQAHGVNWNEEDNDMHLVPQANKDLYGVMNASNYKDWQESPDVVYLPKIDFSTAEEFNLAYFYYMVSLPLISLGVSPNSYLFYECHSLTCIPPIDTSEMTSCYEMFDSCWSLIHVPLLDTSRATNMEYMFYECRSLASIPALDTSSLTDAEGMFCDCSSLTSVPLLDFSNVSYEGDEYLDLFYYEKYNYALRYLGGFEGLSCDTNLTVGGYAAYSRESVLNVFNNLATVSSTKYLKLSSKARAGVTAEDIAIATNKGWTVGWE